MVHRSLHHAVDAVVPYRPIWHVPVLVNKGCKGSRSSAVVEKAVHHIVGFDSVRNKGSYLYQSEVAMGKIQPGRGRIPQLVVACRTETGRLLSLRRRPALRSLTGNDLYVGDRPFFGGLELVNRWSCIFYTVLCNLSA